MRVRDLRLQSVVAALCVFAQLGAVGHHVLVTHTRCAEHGELVHADEHGHGSHGDHDHAVVGDADAVDHAADVQRGALMVVAADSAHADDHDHCNATCDRRKAVLAATGAVEITVRIAANDAALADVAVAPGRAVYCVAPKTSPPA